MRAKRSSIIAASILTLSLCSQAQAQYVRLAELEIDPARLDAYKAAVKEEMETSVRVEPGVLAIYAVAEKVSDEQYRK